MSHQFCVCAFCSLRLSCRRSNTRCWPNVVLLLAHRLRRWANISPVLGYCVVFDATLHVGQRHRRRTNINPAFVKSIVQVLQPAWSRPTDYGWMNTSQHRRCCPNIYLTLGQCRLALPDPQPSKHEALNQFWFYAELASQTGGQNWTSIGSTFRVCWVCWQATFVFCTSPGWKILKLLPNWLSLKTIWLLWIIFPAASLHSAGSQRTLRGKML